MKSNQPVQKPSEPVDIDELSFEDTQEEIERAVEEKRKNEFERGMHYFDKAMSRLETKDCFVFYNFGKACLTFREIDRAILLFTKAIEVADIKKRNNKKYFAYSYYFRGRCYNLLKQFNLAYEDLKTFIAMIPEYAEGRYSAGYACFHLERYTETISHFSKTIELNYKLGDSHNCRGHCYFILKEYQKAYDDFKKAIELNASHLSHAYYHYGMCSFHLKNYEEALLAYERLLEIENNDREIVTHAHSMRWVCLIKLNRTEEAEEARDTILREVTVEPKLAKKMLSSAFQILLFSEKKEYSLPVEEIENLELKTLNSTGFNQ